MKGATFPWMGQHNENINIQISKDHNESYSNGEPFA